MTYNPDVAEKRTRPPRRTKVLTLRGYLVISLVVGVTAIMALSAACLWLAVIQICATAINL